MPRMTKAARAAYQRAYKRQYLINHPGLQDRLNKEARERRRLKKGLPPEAPIPADHSNTLGDPQTPTQKHVVLSRLLRRLLQEAYDKGFLTVDVTNDDTAYEMRVRAALDVSKCLAEKQDEANNSGGDSPG